MNKPFIELFDLLFGRHNPLVDHHKRRECDVIHSDHPFRENETCRPGFVYIIQYGDLFKIGCSAGKRGLASVKARIAAWNKTLGQQGRGICLIKTNCAPGLERWLHDEYREECLRGARYSQVRPRVPGPHPAGSTEMFFLSAANLKAIRAMDMFNGGPLEFVEFP